MFTTGDLERLRALVATAWGSALDRDWSVRAGTLEWTCAATADHAIDTVLALAIFLASRRRDAYPDLWPPFSSDPGRPPNDSSRAWKRRPACSWR